MKTFLTRRIARLQLDAFVAGQATNVRILDLGCAGGPYATHFPNRVGFDVEQRAGVDVVGDAHHLPFEDDSFDIILCSEVLEHLHSPHIAIAEMQRVLKKGGKLILTTRFLFPIHDAPHDYYRYTRHGLEHLFKNWKIETLVEEKQSLQSLGPLLQAFANESEFKGGQLVKGIVLLAAQLFARIPRITREEFGNRRTNIVIKEPSVLASGYYMICVNSK